MNRCKIISVERQVNGQTYPVKLRWYKGFLCQGNQEVIIQKIHNIVHNYQLEKFLLNMYTSKPINSEFYIFLGIQSEKLNDIPSELEEHLIKSVKKLHRYIFTEVSGSFSYYNEIMSYENRKLELKAYEFTKRIPYELPSKIINKNPFDITPSSSKNYSPLLESLNIYVQRYEYLLYWLSSLSSGTWDTFRKSCETLELEEPKRILRKLRLLGHLETSANGSKWSITPTNIVKIESIESSQHEFILCGQRNLKLIDQLKSLGIVPDIYHQPGAEAPSCLRLTVNSHDIITNELPIIYAGKASHKLASFLPEIKTWQQNLISLEIVTIMQQWKKFNGYNNENKFENCGIPHETGMYEMCDENLNLRCTLFYNQKTNTWHQGDWYGLRFLALQYQGIACQSYYNSSTKNFAIPVNQRWPEIYERALVLASGKLPSHQNSWLIYENICKEVACLLTEKLM